MTKTITNEAGIWTITVNVFAELSMTVTLKRYNEYVFSNKYTSMEEAVSEIKRLETFIDEVLVIFKQNEEKRQAEMQEIIKKKQPIVDKLKQLGFTEE